MFENKCKDCKFFNDSKRKTSYHGAYLFQCNYWINHCEPMSWIIRDSSCHNFAPSMEAIENVSVLLTEGGLE